MITFKSNIKIFNYSYGATNKNGGNDIEISVRSTRTLFYMILKYFDLFLICWCHLWELCSTRESSVVNMLLTALHLVFIVFIVVMGFTKGDVKNFTIPENPKNPGGFFPYGLTGAFNGAALVYLSYIGYDAVSTMAEEVHNPVRDIPIGVSGSVIIVTVLYCLMSVSMTMLLPYDAVRLQSNFNSVLFH